MSATQLEPIIALILAGGRGKRAGGIDKGLQNYEGKPLIEHTLERLAAQASTVFISANRNITTYQQYGHEVISDSDPSFNGPLAGIVAASELLESIGAAGQAIMVCPCDTPTLPLDIVAKLQLQMSDRIAACIAHDGQRRHNLHCLINRRYLPSLVSFYTEGGRAIKQWYAVQPCIEVDFSDQADAFQNLNRAI